MGGHECYHCKSWVEAGAAHDCWTTTEAALTRDLADDLRDAWERVRETAVEFGEQRIYASHYSIMFARRACYFFVRPKKKVLELVFFLPAPLKAARIRRVDRASRTRVAHTVHVTHRDEVEAPLTDWLRAAYDYAAPPAAPPQPVARAAKAVAAKRARAAAPAKAKATAKRRRR